MVKVAIVGASGYTGGELLRILLNHSETEIVDVTSRKYDGTPVEKIHPHIRDSGLIFKNKNPNELDADIIIYSNSSRSINENCTRFIRNRSKSN